MNYQIYVLSCFLGFPRSRLMIATGEFVAISVVFDAYSTFLGLLLPRLTVVFPMILSLRLLLNSCTNSAALSK